MVPLQILVRNMGKEALIRKEKLALRKAVEISERQKMNDSIYENVISLKAYESAAVVFLYASTKYEADTFKIMEHALKNKKRVALPLTVSETQMQFYYVDDVKTQLEAGYMGIMEPLADKCIHASAESCELIIVPGSVFDKDLNRMGYGRGYYDRFLAKIDCIKMGLCYELQLTDKIDAKPTDVKMDMLVTEKSVYGRSI